jgi:uncharacterized iron-regulated membrane protein
MQGSLRQSMSWLHTWAGLLLGWVLYFIFVTGTVAYLDTEIDRWMKPELPPARTAAADAVVDPARAYLERHAPGATRWFIWIPIDRNTPYLAVSWQGAQGEGTASGNALLDPATGTVLTARDSGGGQKLYQMHWKLHYMPQAAGEWIVGVATMFMLVALVTGVIVHKKIFADFFTFRRSKGQRSWLDAHNVASVLSLPYQLMITYSGLIFMMFIYMPLVIAASYGPGEQNRQAFLDEVFVPAGVAVEASGEPAELADLHALLAQARQHWGSAPVRSIEVRHPGDRHARVVLRGDFAAGPLRAADVLVFDGVSGALLATQPAQTTVAKSFRDLMLGLHEGLFAGPVLRALFVFSGLLGSAMIATGLVLWTVKRRQRLEKSSEAASPGLRLVERLNVATVVGLLVAITAYFWANRLLPLDLPDRAAWEMHALFIVWGALFVHAALRPAARAWVEQCALGAAAFGLLPLLNALTTERWLAVSLPQGDWVMAGFDLTMLALGALFAALAVYLGRRHARAAGIAAQPDRLRAGAGERRPPLAGPKVNPAGTPK